MDQFHFLKDFHNQTTLHPLALVMLFASVLSVFLLPRRYALVPMLATACLIAPAQRVVVLGLDFTFLRLVVIATWIRVLWFQEHVGFKLRTIDRVVIAWIVYSLAAYVVLYPNVRSLTYQVGVAFDAATIYFVARMLASRAEVFAGLARGAAVLAVPLAGAFMLENMTGQNVFAVFGGVPAETMERYGRIRAQAAFAHPIVAGVFWASLIPIMLIVARRSVEQATLAVVGCLAALVIIWCSSSSTPVLLVGIISASIAIYPLRSWLPTARLVGAVTVVLLHIAMFAPVWHLFARINFFRGSTGWWRYLIIDTFVENWTEWIVYGTTNSHQWLLGGLYSDVTNQYVTEGINGGLIKLGLFVAMLVLALAAVGRVVRASDATAGLQARGSWRWRLRPPRGPRVTSDGPTALARPILAADGSGATDPTATPAAARWTAWCLGITVTVQVAAYFATSYFGQLILMQYLALGLAASAPAVLAPMRRVRLVTATDPEAAASAPPVVTGGSAPIAASRSSIAPS